MTKRKLKKHTDTWREWLRPEDCLARFKNRIVTKLQEWRARVRNLGQIEQAFTLLAGQPPKSGSLDALLDDLNQDFTQTCIPKAVHGTKSIAEICFVIECLFVVVQQHDQRSLASLRKAVREAVAMSPGIAVEFTIQGNEVRLRPAGDRFLDKVAVDEVMLALGRHPEVSKHFQEALKICASGETARYRNALDNLRFGLETLLKKVLGNSKSLENQKLALLPWLKTRGLHQQIVNMYESLLFGPYSIYQNDAVKHNEAFAAIEIEFMIYLTGTFMRLLLDLSAKSAKSLPPTNKSTGPSMASAA
jgi:hypothetical protein